MGDLAADTTLEGGDGRYRARLSPDWEVWGPGGGYLATLALRAAAATAPGRRPASISCHFLRVAAFDEVALDVTTLHGGRRAASLRVSMTQGGRPVVEALVWVVAATEGLRHDAAPMPEVPAPETLPSWEELAGDQERSSYRFWENIENRPLDWVPRHALAPRDPVARNWFRFRPRATFDDPCVDAARALVLLDTMLWPAAFRAHAPEPGYVAPNLDVCVQFHRAAPASDWLYCEATAPVADGGLVGGRAAVWSRAGRLLASGAGQLLCRPSAPTR